MAAIAVGTSCAAAGIRHATTAAIAWICSGVVPLLPQDPPVRPREPNIVRTLLSPWEPLATGVDTHFVAAPAEAMQRWGDPPVDAASASYFSYGPPRICSSGDQTVFGRSCRIDIRAQTNHSFCGQRVEYIIPTIGAFMHVSVECMAAEPRTIFAVDLAAKVIAAATSVLHCPRRRLLSVCLATE